MLTKISDKNRQAIIDSGSWSCVNAIASSMVTKVELKVVSHPRPYKLSWVNSTYDVKERYFFPDIQFVTYSDKIWCDVVTIDNGHIILGKIWLHDLDVTIYGRSNLYSFVHDEKVKLAPCDLSLHLTLNGSMHQTSRKH